MARRFDCDKFFKEAFKEEGESLEDIIINILGGLIRTKKGKGIAAYLESEKIKDAVKRWQKKGYNIEQIKEKLYEGVTGGKYLSKRGKEILLKNELRYKPTLLQRIVHPIHSIKRTINPSYSEKVVHAVTEIMQYAEAGGLKEHMPEWLVDDAAKLQNLYFLGTATKIFEDYKLMSRGEARNLEYLADKKVRSEGETIIKKTKEEIKKYGMAQGTAVASLVAAFFLLGFSASHMTGFVIAGNNIPSGYPVAAGFILLIITLCLSLFRRKKKKPEKRKQKKAKKIKR